MRPRLSDFRVLTFRAFGRCCPYSSLHSEDEGQREEEISQEDEPLRSGRSEGLGINPHSRESKIEAQL